MSFDDQVEFCRVISGHPVWVDIGGHESVGWSARKAAEVTHLADCGPKCPPLCGAASEILGIAAVRASHRGDLIVPVPGAVLSLRDVLAIVACGVGASCTAIVIDDFGAIVAQRPTESWWRSFAGAAEAAAADGVRVWLLGAPRDLARWPECLPCVQQVRRGNDWWMGTGFGGGAGEAL